VIRFALSPINVISALCLLAAGVAHFHAYRFFQPDDTFIFLVYAQNLLHSNGLTFNGEVVEGFSSLSWTLIVSIAGLLTDDLLSAAKMTSLITYISHAILLAALLKRWRPATTALDAAIVVGLFFAMPAVAIWAASGMETILFSLLLTTAAFGYLIESYAAPTKMRGVISGLLFGLIATTRPEGVALIAIPCCYEFARLLFLRTCNWKTLFTTCLIFCGLTLLLMIWRQTWFGEWLPTTVQAKTGNLRLQIVNGISYAKGFCSEYFYLVAAYVAACFYLFLNQDSRTRFFALMSAVTTCGYLMFVVAAGGDWMLSFRLLAPLMPIALLTIALALSHFKTARRVLLVLPILVFAITDSWALYAPTRQQAASDNGDIVMGQYIRSLGLPSSAKVAVIDAGAIPYFSALPTIDMIGLNNTHIAKLPGGFFQKFDNGYVLSQQPQIIQMHTEQRPAGSYAPAPVFVGTVQLFYSDEFQKNYELDMRSPIKHLFRRREIGLPQSMMASFYEFSAQVMRDAEHGNIALRITKSGDGLWVAAPAQQLGSIHIGYRIEDRQGKILSEKSIPLKNDMMRSDILDIALTAQDTVDAARIVIDPVLIGVARFSDSGKLISIDVAP